MKNTLAIVVVLLMFGSLVPVASSQGLAGGFGGGIGVGVGPDGPKLSGFGDVDLEKTIEHWAENGTQNIVPQMELQIDQIADVCELSEAEAKKLTIAVKGIVTRRIAAGSEQIETFAYKSGLVPRPDVEPAEDADTEGDVEGEEESGDADDEWEHDSLELYSASPAGGGIVDLQTYFTTPLTEHPLWNRTLAGTLTEAQFAQYEKYRIGRNQALLNSAVETWVICLDSEVFLSPAQVNEVTTYMIEQLRDGVSMNSPTSMAHANRIVTESFDAADSLDSLLNEPQAALRKSLRAEPGGGSRVSWGSAPDR